MAVVERILSAAVEALAPERACLLALGPDGELRGRSPSTGSSSAPSPTAGRSASPSSATWSRPVSPCSPPTSAATRASRGRRASTASASAPSSRCPSGRARCAASSTWTPRPPSAPSPPRTSTSPPPSRSRPPSSSTGWRSTPAPTEALARSDERVELLQAELLRHEIVGRVSGAPPGLRRAAALRPRGSAGAAPRRDGHGQGALRPGLRRRERPRRRAAGCRSPSPRSPRPSWSRSSSATCAAPSPRRPATRRAGSRWPTRACSSSTRSATSSRRCRRSSCASSTRASSSGWATPRPGAWTRSSSPPRTGRSRRTSRPGRFRADLLARLGHAVVDPAAAGAPRRTSRCSSSTCSRASIAAPCATGSSRRRSISSSATTGRSTCASCSRWSSARSASWTARRCGRSTCRTTCARGPAARPSAGGPPRPLREVVEEAETRPRAPGPRAHRRQQAPGDRAPGHLAGDLLPAARGLGPPPPRRRAGVGPTASFDPRTGASIVERLLARTYATEDERLTGRLARHGRCLWEGCLSKEAPMISRSTRRFLAPAVAVALSLGLAACGGDDDSITSVTPPPDVAGPYFLQWTLQVLRKSDGFQKQFQCYGTMTLVQGTATASTATAVGLRHRHLGLRPGVLRPQRHRRAPEGRSSSTRTARSRPRGPVPAAQNVHFTGQVTSSGSSRDRVRPGRHDRDLPAVRGARVHLPDQRGKVSARVGSGRQPWSFDWPLLCVAGIALAACGSEATTSATPPVDAAGTWWLTMTLERRASRRRIPRAARVPRDASRLTQKAGDGRAARRRPLLVSLRRTAQS